MSYPAELDTDDTEVLAAYIERRYPTEQLRIHESKTIRFTYWDVSHRSVSSEFLDHIQRAIVSSTQGLRRCRDGEHNVPGWNVRNTNRERTQTRTRI